MPNGITVVGNATRDPETRQTATGKTVCQFGLADNVGWGDKKGTIFYDVTVWGKPAEWAQRDIRKGDACTVIGRLGKDVWTGNDGQARETLTITASEVCAHVRTDQQDAAPRARPAEPPASETPAPPLPPYPAAPAQTATPDEEIDEIPF